MDDEAAAPYKQRHVQDTGAAFSTGRDSTARCGIHLMNLFKTTGVQRLYSIEHQAASEGHLPIKER